MTFHISNAARARGGVNGCGRLSRDKIYYERRKHRRELLVAYGVRPLKADMENYTNVARNTAAPGPCAKPGCDYQPQDWLDAAKHYRSCIGDKSILHKLQTLRPGDE